MHLRSKHADPARHRAIASDRGATGTRGRDASISVKSAALLTLRQAAQLAVTRSTDCADLVIAGTRSFAGIRGTTALTGTAARDAVVKSAPAGDGSRQRRQDAFSTAHQQRREVEHDADAAGNIACVGGGVGVDKDDIDDARDELGHIVYADTFICHGGARCVAL